MVAQDGARSARAGYSCVMGDGIRGRPLGIWMIVGMQVLTAIINILDVAFGTNLTDTNFQELASQSEYSRFAILFWGVLIIVASLWLLSLRRRGWALMMFLVGLALAVHISIWWNDAAQTAWLRFALAVITAFYLNSAGVRSLFFHRREVSRISLGGRQEAE